MTETDVQQAIWRWADKTARCRLAVPNVFLFHGESDFVLLTQTDLLIEVEIKISLADFRTELDPRKQSADKANKHRMMALTAEGLAPNRYYFAAPEGLLPLAQIPHYAGLLEITRPVHVRADGTKYPGQPVVIRTKQAPKLHTRTMSPEQLMAIARSLCWRYWRQRTKSLRK